MPKSLEPSKASSFAHQRLEAMSEALGEHAFVDKDADLKQPIDIFGFERNFVEECDTDAEDLDGIVLVTSGMSDLLGAEGQPLPTELLWYVPEANAEYIQNLRWLAKLSSIDGRRFEHGLLIPMPKPPLTFSQNNVFLLLTSVIQTDRHLFDEIEREDESISTLVVHLLSEKEYELVKTDEGFDRFLDMLDENDYPLVFDPLRKSYV